MRAGMRYLLVAAWLVAGSSSLVLAQQPPLPAAPQPVIPPGGQPAIPPGGQPLMPPVLGQPVPAIGPAVPAPAPPPSSSLPPVPAVPAPASSLPPVIAPPPVIVPAPGPSPFVDPGRDGWANVGVGSKPAGLFLNTDLEILWPSIKNHLSATVTFPNGTTDTLHVPQANLDVTAQPGFEVGYHLPDSLGDLVFGYRFLVTDGHKDLTASFGDSAVRSRLDINQFNLDYATATYSPLPRYDLKFSIGARLTSIYFDSQASNQFNYQQASNYFVGAGPSAGIDFERRFKDLPELGLFLHADGAVLDGQVRQKFRENLAINTPGEQDAYFEAQKTQVSEVLTLQAGFIYHPFGVTNDHLRITGGYQFQQWWGVGKINGSVAPANVSSSADITAQGVFLRGEFDF
jgi:hypothetical protein